MKRFRGHVFALKSQAPCQMFYNLFIHLFIRLFIYLHFAILHMHVLIYALEKRNRGNNGKEA